MKTITALILAAAVLVAAPADAATNRYRHRSELNFHPVPDHRAGSHLPVLRPAQHCQMYRPRYFAYFNGRVLVCA